jgi:hypothetical protein
VAQADFGRNLKPAPAAKLLVFSDFSFANHVGEKIYQTQDHMVFDIN